MLKNTLTRLFIKRAKDKLHNKIKFIIPSLLVTTKLWFSMVALKDDPKVATSHNTNN
jgi:hypothetical protein